MRDPIAILGAGCAGLSAAWRLARQGYPVVLLERADHVGGLAGGVHLNGNVYEYGPHIFHTTDAEILADIRSIMGDDLIPYHRTIQIKFMRNYFQFPLAVRDVLFKLPPLTVLQAGLSFLWHFAAGLFRKPEVETSETLLRRYYGQVLYEIFFKSYIEHVWGISPADFSPSFARQRIPRLNFVDLWDRLVSAVKERVGPRKVQTEDYVEKVEGHHYTTKAGFSLITQRMADKIVALGGRQLLNARVTGLVRDDGRISAVEYEQDGVRHRQPCQGVVNTLPLNEAVCMLQPPADEPVRAAAAQLRYRALVFVGLLVRRPKALRASFMYFREHSFNRISDLAQFGFHIRPEGCTLLVAEISCDVKDRPWWDDDHARDIVLADLIREDLIKPDEVLETHVFRAEHAYPIYTLHYEQHLGTLLDWAKHMANFETAGRQGRFAYVNTHIAMKQGYEAADRLAQKLAA